MARAAADGARAPAWRRTLSGWVPLAVVLAVLVALMYPVALLLGLPLARTRMDNVANWVRATTTPKPLAEAPADVGAGAPAGAELRFGGAESLATARSVLVYGDRPVDATYDLEDGAARLRDAVAGPLLEWGEALTGPLDARSPGLGVADPSADAATGARASEGVAGHVFALPAGGWEALYLGDRLLVPGADDAIERPDGVLAAFTFPEAETGPVLVNGQLLLEGEGFEANGRRIELRSPAPFNASVRRVSGDYAVLDAAAGTIALAEASAEPPRAATATLAVVERLVGEVDGVNRVFHLQHAPLVESDPGRRIMLEDVELSPAAERPAERVDGERKAFTFTSDRGVVTVNGAEALEGRDFGRAGPVVTFTVAPPRNAALRQYPDYVVNDPAVGVITLAKAPAPGSRVWAATYTYYDHPACGSSEIECFLSMPQHPMPFPHWIAKRIPAFLTNYPLSDTRNVVRATLYTAGGTLTALALGGVLGVLLAIVFVAIRPLERALLPWVIASQTVPIIALVPVLLLLLGNAGVTVQTSLVPAALIGAYIAFFPVTVGTVTGLRSVDPLSLDLMKSYASSPLQVFWKVRFPAAVPYLFVSLKLGAAAALVGALVAETESNNRLGLGYAIVGQVQAGNVSDVWILLLISAALGIGLVAIVGLLQRFTAPWERR
ncbi:MAG: ABC transporter permease subunit [Trueperaceae bacterium]|nr:ABC transporter permease subunit [Trueperaceae bacterium]MCO5173489.1 ABC transporter permease subunit [Trueperaceae bacterium]MCW5820251.1 ABC transporter permease subunit [Trueperaceae bacterium]